MHFRQNPWPRQKLKKGAKTTSKGMSAAVSFTLTAPQLDVLGFATEGVSQSGGVKGQAVTRTMQVALTLGGGAYREDVQVSWKLAKKGDSGQITQLKSGK